MPMKEIQDIEKKMKKGNPKDAKMRLAREVVTLYHGDEAAKHEEEQFTSVFSKHELPEDMQEMKVGKKIQLIDVMMLAKLVSSKSEARRLIEQGGVKLNDMTIGTVDAMAQPGVLKVGKRKFLKLV
jgi:tyrosyl-tRNA synthetase